MQQDERRTEPQPPPPRGVAGRRHHSIVPVGTSDTLTQTPTHGFGIVTICGLQR